VLFRSETLYTADKTVIMEGIVPEGATETISVWARKTETLEGIQACNDGYVVTVPEEEEPPPPEDPPPPVTVTEEEPPPPVQEIVVTEEPAPEPEPEPEPTPQPVHAAAPKVADTGPGILIYVFGAGIGGALLRKKRQK
jgi:outer membrane biosynthesis protein TonB